MTGRNFPGGNFIFFVEAFYFHLTECIDPFIKSPTVGSSNIHYVSSWSDEDVFMCGRGFAI
jgi:hypothetical protein